MAKQNGILKIEGTLDGLTFYKSADGYQVRTKGGVSRKRILTDPAFIRTRENGNEFKECALAGKTLRMATGGMASRAKDSKLSSRMLGVLSKVKNYDLQSLRGERTVGRGLETDEGKLLLKGFDFNAKAPLKNILKCAFEIEETTRKLSFSGFDATAHINAPNGATHFTIQSALANVNFETKDAAIAYSEAVNAVLNPEMEAFELMPSEIPVGEGVQLHLLLIEFFQEVNRVQYSLKNGAHNVLHVLEVT